MTTRSTRRPAPAAAVAPAPRTQPTLEELTGPYRPAHLYDNRVAHRYVHEGIISREGYRQFLDGLEDVEGRADWVDPMADGELQPTRVRVSVNMERDED